MAQTKKKGGQTAAERARAVYVARVRELAAIIRAERLDEDVPDDAPQTAERTAREELAAKLIAERGEAEMDAATKLAVEIGELADASCGDCCGLGALVAAQAPVEAERPAEAERQAGAYRICPCVAAASAERVRKAAAAQPAFQASRPGRPANADRRIEAARKELEELLKDQLARCSKLDGAIAAAESSAAGAAPAREALVARGGELRSERDELERALAARREELEAARAAVRAAEAALGAKTESIDAQDAAVRAHDEGRAEADAALTELRAARGKVAGRVQPKIDRARRRLRRLRLDLDGVADDGADVVARVTGAAAAAVPEAPVDEAPAVEEAAS